MRLIHIAIAEDDNIIAELLAGLFADEGYTTQIYYSATDAYEGIAQELPNLIITDLQMEHQEAGLELLKRVRTNPQAKHIPIILYSANAQLLRDRARAVEYDNCVILAKPFELHDLLSTVERLLEG